MSRRSDAKLLAEIDAALERWRPVFGLSEVPIIVAIEDAPFGNEKNLAATSFAKGNSKYKVSVSRNWNRDAAWGVTLDEIIVHELMHMVHSRAGAQEIYASTLQLLEAAGVSEAVRKAVEDNLDDLEEQTIHAMEQPMLNAYEAGRAARQEVTA